MKKTILAALRSTPICRDLSFVKKSEPSLKQSAWYFWY